MEVEADPACKGPVLLSDVLRNLIKSLHFPGTGSTALGPEECLDATTKGLWKCDLTWSKEASELRRKAITSPNKAIFARAKNDIQHLRIIDKQITDVDEGLLDYVNLEELTLTGNLLTNIPPRHLPHNLKIMELCYNRLISLDDLDETTHAKLQHFGVSYNQIDHILLTPTNWSALVSLDLSYNLLSNIQETVQVLSQLETLRNTSLMGNPLSLVPCYRSFVINSVPHLVCLDDEDVTVIERGVAKGVAKLCTRDFLQAARFEMKLTSIEGLPTLKEVADEEQCLTRFMLVVRHSFIQSKNYKRLDSDSGEAVTSQLQPSTSTTNGSNDFSSASSDEDSVCLKETAYLHDSSSITPMCAKYQVGDLNGLAKLLASGVAFSLSLRRLVYTQKPDELGEQPPSKGGKLQKMVSKVSTSGSRQPSRASSRKSVAVPAGAGAEKKGKNRSSLNSSLQLGAALPNPEEGWKLDKDEGVSLGTFSVNLAALLQRSKQNVVKEHCKTSLQLKLLEDKGLVEQQEAERVKSGESATEERRRMSRENDRMIEVDVEVHLQTISSEQQMMQQC